MLIFQKKSVHAFQKCVRPKATAHLRGSWDSLSLTQQNKTRKEKTLMERIGETDKQERKRVAVSGQQTAH